MVNPHFLLALLKSSHGDPVIFLALAQVRRILSLDPSKYKNGRLPFGLKPDKARENLVNMEQTMEQTMENHHFEWENIWKTMEMMMENGKSQSKMDDIWGYPHDLGNLQYKYKHTKNYGKWMNMTIFNG